MNYINEHSFSQWLAYLQMVSMGISFELLADTFNRLITRWKPMELDKVNHSNTTPIWIHFYVIQDEECVLADSLVQFGEFCRAAILKHRLRIRTRGGSSRRRSPSPKRSELESFGEMLRCYRLANETHAVTIHSLGLCVKAQCLPIWYPIKSRSSQRCENCWLVGLQCWIETKPSTITGWKCTRSFRHRPGQHRGQSRNGQNNWRHPWVAFTASSIECHRGESGQIWDCL